ncbi:hypothetical protein Godav_002389 [Gossypium davidsonii]|uniref:Uncharacterized protein n=1 Tax=Gossypium davidsonii TaxID=34287 RepID=A0A7J8SVZ9_GOSDV|nr:hypothetical protein [Gossypium davidsonii]
MSGLAKSYGKPLLYLIISVKRGNMREQPFGEVVHPSIQLETISMLVPGTYIQPPFEYANVKKLRTIKQCRLVQTSVLSLKTTQIQS